MAKFKCEDCGIKISYMGQCNKCRDETVRRVKLAIANRNPLVVEMHTRLAALKTTREILTKQLSTLDTEIQKIETEIGLRAYNPSYSGGRWVAIARREKCIKCGEYTNHAYYNEEEYGNGPRCYTECVPKDQRSTKWMDELMSEVTVNGEEDS